MAGFFAVAAPSGLAQMQVFGSGLARDCYVLVKEAKVPAAQVIETCTFAINQEYLSRRNRVATYINRGIAHMRAEHESLALADFDVGIKAGGDIPETWINRGAVLYLMGRYSDALDNLNRGLGAKENYALAALHYNRALTHEKLGDVQAAYADFKRALVIDPKLTAAEKQLTRFRVVGAS